MKEYRKALAREWRVEVVEQLRKTHKCNGCVWGRWTEIKYVCLLPNCLKGLGNFEKRV